MPSHEIRETQRLSKLFFSTPSLPVSICLMFLASLMLGFATALLHAHPGEGASAMLVQGMLFSLSFFALPAALSPLLSIPLGAHMPSPRAYLISLAALALAGTAYLSGLQFYPNTALASALAMAFTFQTFATMAVAGAGYLRALAPAAAQSALMLAGLPLSGDALAGMQPGTYAILAQALLLSAALMLVSRSAIALLEAPLRPMKIGLLELAGMVFANIENGSKSLEKAYSQSAQKIKAPVSLISIRARGKTKAIILSSFIHPGPFGKLCSSDMPAALTRALSEKTGAAAFFTKGAGTHDTNLASSDQIPHLTEAYMRLLPGLEYTEKTTEFRRAGERPSIFAFAFKGTVIAASTFSPGTTDDIELGVGINALGEMGKHAKNPIFIEAHNCLIEPIPPLASGSEAAERLVLNVGRISRLISRERTHRMSAGVAKIAPRLGAACGMGSEGLGLALFEINRSKYALLFADSNNLGAGIREALIGRLKQNGAKDAEVITSDTHSVNTINSGENPLCAKGGVGALLSVLDPLYAQALDDMEPAEIAAAQDTIEAEVFGHGASARWFSAISAVSAEARALAPAAVFACIALLILAGALAGGPA